MSLQRPQSITGGCLCGSVRYKVEFAEDHDWKTAPHTCQCTQCRKNTGTLVYHFHTVTASELTWLSKSTYAEYISSPGCIRAFCKNCGSPLLWTDTKVGSDMELAVGGFDEVVLLGERDGEDKAMGGYALALVNPEGDHFHIRNEIQGVTEEVSEKGRRFWEGSKMGPME